jgi:hypothetical protein
MIVKIIKECLKLDLNKILIVVGEHEEIIKQTINKFNFNFEISFIKQQPQLGTGHAIMCCMDYLKKLWTYTTYLYKKIMRHISKNLKFNNLKELNLSHNWIGDEGAEEMAEALKSTNCKLEYLDLNANDIRNSGAKSIANVLESGKFNNIKKLLFLNLKRAILLIND